MDPRSNTPTGGYNRSPAPDKSSQLLIREYPHRALAIVSSSHSLIFRYSATSDETNAQAHVTPTSLTGASAPVPRSRGGADGPSAKCMVEFVRNTPHTLQGYRPLTPRPIYGTLGLISVQGDVFLCVVTHTIRTATVRAGETIERIASVAFYCLSSPEYDDVFSMDSVDSDYGDPSAPYGQNLSHREVAVEQHPCFELRKLLSNGSFYYSTDFDLTNRLQDRPLNSASFDIDNFDESFLWNHFMINPLVKFRSRLMLEDKEALDSSRILTSAIRGFCGTTTIPQAAAPLRSKSSGLPSYLTVISRLSSRRAGTRFNARGIDDDGNVANFVETETTYWSPSGALFSYVQVRGSLPVFWEQAPDLIPGRQKITVTRSPDGTQPAFDKHFQDLEQTYGAVHVVNLLSDAKPGEAELTHLYRYGIEHCPLSHSTDKQSADHVLLRATEYDFHAETRALGYEAARDIRRYIEQSVDGFAYFLAEEMDDAADVADEPDSLKGLHSRLVVVLQQEGVFRTNCLDCLDRTNLIQTIISQMAVEAFLGHRGEYAASDFWVRHSGLWADNGDSLSKIYAGTGALKTSFTRHGKMSLSGAMADLRKSAQRLYHNNFTDPARQMVIDLLLGRLVGQATVQLFDPISDFVSMELSKRSAEYSSSSSINMWVGTFNLNGRTDGLDHDLSAWLWPDILQNTQPDIVAVGFQEIVELSPQQIMNSDPSRKQLWERAVRKTLNHRASLSGGEKYVLLRSGQLVGAALCIFVRASVLRHIKNVEGSVKKTGMSGMAGNKGAVAIRFEYANTQICFVTAHLAAGFANYDERNRDYATIHHGLRFQRNRGIDDHDTVIWLGDFNYRIGLSWETTRSLVQRRDLGALYENDQLNLQMVAGLAFQYYSEAKIDFLPTYKFDIGTDDYDSSDKARIPAWTDRILRKGTNIRQLAYDSASLRFSDHRPVYAVFRCTVTMIDEVKRRSISDQLYAQRSSEVGNTVANADVDSTDDEDLIGYDAIEPGLPPASSDQHKWWLDNGRSARTAIAPPRAREGSIMALNPNRPSNPFGPADEVDWVAIPRSSSRLSPSSISSSPFEVVNIPLAQSMGMGAVTGRRLPPQMDASGPDSHMRGRGREEGSDANGRLPRKQDTVPPPPPPPRRQTTGPLSNSHPTAPLTFQRTQTGPSLPERRPTSALSQAVRESRSTKSPPAVARKPQHLATAGTSPDDDRRKEQDVTASLNYAGNAAPPLPIRIPTGLQDPRVSSVGVKGSSVGAAGNGIKKAAPPKPPKPDVSRSGTVEPGPRPPPGSVGLPGMMNSSTVGTRPQVAVKLQKTIPVDLLDSLDDGPSRVDQWKPLSPTTQRGG